MKYRRIRDLREDHDLTQVELADYLNISQRAYSYYELGERSVPIEVFIKLANYYHTTIDYLVNLTDEK